MRPHRRLTQNDCKFQQMDASKDAPVRLALGASMPPPQQCCTRMLKDHTNAGLHRIDTSRDTLVCLAFKARSTSRFNSVVSVTYGLRPFVHYHSRLWYCPRLQRPYTTYVDSYRLYMIVEILVTLLLYRPIGT